MRNKTAVIIGGASGMGLGVAKELGVHGTIFIGDLGETGVQNAVEELRALGINAHGQKCDVTDISSLHALAQAAAEIGPIGCAINTAGVAFTDADTETIMKVNALGIINFDNAFLNMVPGGVVVNFASMSGWMYNPTNEDLDIWNDPNADDFVEKCIAKVENAFMAYCFSKRFVIYHTMANATRFAKNKTRIISISPGSIETPMSQQESTAPIGIDSIVQEIEQGHLGNTHEMTRLNSMTDHSVKSQEIGGVNSTIEGIPLGRNGHPEEIAQTIINLMDHHLSYLTGTDISVDGGRLASLLTKQIS
jgi:NAD(P)-dependent dehydrogenase (short-subunit alcohol dehydrogenase family)